MGLGAYIVGFATLVATAGGGVAAGVLLVRRRLDGLRGSARVAALGLTITAALVVAHVLPGAVGLLYPGVVAALAVALAGACSLLPHAAFDAAPPVASHDPPLSRGLALAAIAIVGVACLAYLRMEGGRVPLGVDALSFHFPDAARWMQQHGFWRLHQFIPDLSHATYPNNGDVLALLALLPFGDLGLARWVFVPWLLLTGVCVHALAHELGAPRTTAAVFGAAAVGLPVVARSALIGDMPDVVMYSTFTAGLLFMVRSSRSGSRAELVLGGLGLGLALGTKWYGVSAAAVVLLVWLGARRGVRDGLLVCGVALAAGGFWLLRNLILAGNPVFPLKVAVGGLVIFDAPYDVVRARGGFTLAHYAGDTSVWRPYIWAAFKDSFGFAPLALAAGTLAAAWLTRARREAVAVALIAVGLAVAYALTPYSAQGPDGLPVQVSANTRYGVPALLVAAALTASLASRGARWRLVLEAGGVLLALDGARRAFDLPGRTVVTTAVVAAVLVAIAWAARPAPRAAVAAALLVIAFAAARRADTHLDDRPWRGDPALAWVLDHADGGHRVGLAGVWPIGSVSAVLPAFGDRLDNRVVYIGPFERHMLRRYTTAAPFVARLRRERIELLLVGRGYPQALARTPEEAWARAAGMRLLVRSANTALYGW